MHFNCRKFFILGDWKTAKLRAPDIFLYLIFAHLETEAALIPNFFPLDFTAI